MKKQLLIILPHPDDESFIGGSVALYAKQGYQITYICLTLGEMGRNMGNPLFANRETIRMIRQHELTEAANILGIHEVRSWGYWDKTVEFEDQNKLIERIKGVLEEIKPEIVITFYPGYSVHPDHEACGTAVIAATHLLPKEKRPLLQCIAFAKNSRAELGEPDIISDVSEVLDLKKAALKAHRSQNFASKLEDDTDQEKPEALKRLHIEEFWLY